MKKLTTAALLSMGVILSTQVLATPVASSQSPTSLSVSTTTTTATYTFTLTPGTGETITTVTGLTSATGSTSCTGTTSVSCTYTYDSTKRPLMSSDSSVVKITFTNARGTYTLNRSVPVAITLPAASKS